jgi:hypothetical protein
VFRGHIIANSGELNNVTIKENALFQGKIISGPLVLSNEAPCTEESSYNTGTSAKVIIDTEVARLGIASPISGVYTKTVYGSKYRNRN